MTLLNKSAAELQSLLHNREVSVKELTEESLARIAKMDESVQAFLSTNDTNRHWLKQKNWTSSRWKAEDHSSVYRSE